MSNKTSDENVGSIEEDIRILQEKDCMWHYPETRIEEAIENIIADYTRQKEMNEEHQRINGELREKVKELEEERQLVGIPVRNKRNGKIGIVLHQWENGSIAVLERINPRIINTHDSWNTLEIITDEVKQVQTQDDTISKQAVIDKIKEVRSKRIKHEIDNKLLLDGVREKYLNNKGKFDSCELVTYCIHNEYLGEEHYLQELLEGEK